MRQCSTSETDSYQDAVVLFISPVFDFLRIRCAKLVFHAGCGTVMFNFLLL